MNFFYWNWSLHRQRSESGQYSDQPYLPKPSPRRKWCLGRGFVFRLLLCCVSNGFQWPLPPVYPFICIGLHPEYHLSPSSFLRFSDLWSNQGYPWASVLFTQHPLCPGSNFGCHLFGQPAHIRIQTPDSPSSAVCQDYLPTKAVYNLTSDHMTCYLALTTWPDHLALTRSIFSITQSDFLTATTPAQSGSPLFYWAQYSFPFWNSFLLFPFWNSFLLLLPCTTPSIHIHSCTLDCNWISYCSKMAIRSAPRLDSGIPPLSLVSCVLDTSLLRAAVLSLPNTVTP